AAPVPWGDPVAIDLVGTQVSVDGEPAPHVETIAAPLHLEPIEPTLPVIAFGDASVGELHGTVIVVGTGIAATSGSIGIDAPAELQLDDARAWVRAAAASDDDGVRPTLPADAPADHQAALAASARYDVAVNELELAGFDAAYVVTDTGSVALEGPIAITSSTMYMGQGSRIGSMAIAARWEGEVFIGIATQSGELTDADGLPVAILARDARLDVGPDHVRSLEDVPVRQALDADTALVASSVELRSCQADTLVFWQGETRILRMAYHQDDGLTDAVFADAWVEERETATMLSARWQLSAELPAQLTTAAQQHPNATWGQGLIDFVETWAEVTQAIVEGLACAFTLGFVCPDDGPSASPAALLPYPAWMIPGAAGEFELELTAPYEPGEYELVVHVIGQNYEATLPLHVVVQ
ncbi:MAG TPA: hypothetical protein VG755_02380, partial [Nannocystaceae bacterium]|nr:hypothetical protein [Nannocystaceae bacterium]